MLAASPANRNLTVQHALLFCLQLNGSDIMSRKRTEESDPDEVALIQWCTEVEELFVQAGASRNDAQQHIEDEAEWFTDMFYEGLTPAEAAKAALN